MADPSNSALRNADGRLKYRAARAFYLTLFIGTCFAAYALLSTNDHDSRRPSSSIHARSLEQPISALDDEDICRGVRHAQDQCAFVRAKCPDDEGGFTAYLDLFYCKLPHAKPVAFIILISWLGLLFSTIGIAASDFFCIDLSTIAAILGMSESMAGVTFLAFGNGSPDVFSTFAAMSTNSGSLALGELFGAAGFITAVVAGSMALIRPFMVAKKAFIRDVGFFLVAAAFSMIFLWDGKLRFWECAAMVIYYILYVIFVVVWHWWMGRRKRRREREAAIRGHFVPPEEEPVETYRDDPEEEPSNRSPSLARGASREDWSVLENGSAEPHDDDQDEDVEEEDRQRWMSDLANNMRLTRPSARSRRNTVNPVRPSLVGALEFQAVMKSLNKSRNFQTIPLDSRRYSDDPTFTTLQQQDQMSSQSDPAARPPYEVRVTDESTPVLERPGPEPYIPAPNSATLGRARALTANDAANMRVKSSFNSNLSKLTTIQSEDNLTEASNEERQRSRERSVTTARLALPGTNQQLTSPTILVEPGTPRRETPIGEVRTPGSAHSAELLAPPGLYGNILFHRPQSEHFVAPPLSRNGSDLSTGPPQTVPRAKQLPKIVIPHRSGSPSSSRATSPFPAYRDHPSPSLTTSTRSPVSTRPPSIYLPPPAALASPESIPIDQAAEQEVPRRPTKLTKYWPKVLPPPGVIVSTLLPTIYHWHEKTWWEKLLGLVAAPSVFLLTITLPVVESERDSEIASSVQTPAQNGSYDSVKSRSKSASAVPMLSPGATKGLVPEFVLDPSDDRTPGSHRHTLNPADVTSGPGGTASVATHAEDHYREAYHDNPHKHASISAEPQALRESILDEFDSQPELWGRWLLIIQLFLAPIFCVLSIYIQSPAEMEPSWLIRPILICLLISLVLLIPLLLTTTPTHRPEVYRVILSFAGFVVAIAWISTVASQVVGALKALAVILNMSHAIMGLTIFAVGNSLGDLVADVTVAKLGYPVMALSACFGGPMLNILLGIGLSGSYILLRGAEHRHHKHPDKGLKFKTYHIEVSKTLIVSGITLLVTLVIMIVVVPLNKWVLSRKIGWALIALWTISTIFNVIIEVTGILGEVELFGSSFV